jgi:diguanylate cyclase (GGDEF)-like protein
MRKGPELGLARRQEFDRSLARREGRTSWLLITVQGLLAVNLHHGWDYGNRFISLVAERLRSLVGPHDLVAHVSGHEFAVLLEGGSLTAAEDFATAARRVLGQPADVGPAVVETRPVVTVVTTDDQMRDPWSLAYTAHHENGTVATRNLVRGALARAGSLEDLASIAANGGLDQFGWDAIEVRLGAITATAGTIPPDITPHLLDITADGEPIGYTRWWSRSGEVDTIPSSTLAMVSDELARAAQRHMMLSDAETDPMTGLLNRRGLARRGATITTPYSVALVELDDMKRINDTLGHHVGDEALMSLTDALRDGRHGEVAARWGGDEFVLVLPGATVEEAAGRLRRLLRQLGNSTNFGGRGISFSAGVAPGGGDLDCEIRLADGSMYEAKRAGKAQVIVANPPA